MIKIIDIKVAKPCKTQEEFEQKYKTQIEHYKKVIEQERGDTNDKRRNY